MIEKRPDPREPAWQARLRLVEASHSANQPLLALAGLMLLVRDLDSRLLLGSLQTLPAFQTRGAGGLST